MLTNEWALKKSVYFSVIHYQSCARMCRCASLTFACLFNCAERARLFAQPILLQISAPKGTFSGSFMIFLCTFLKQKVALGAGGLFIRIFPLTRIPPRERERERRTQRGIRSLWRALNKCQKLTAEFFFSDRPTQCQEQQVTKIIDYN